MVKQAAKAVDVSNALAAFASPTRATDLQWFFKTEPGAYGAGDKFLGIRVPDTRSVAKQFTEITLAELQKLAKSKWHEERLCALVILNSKFTKSKSKDERESFLELWLAWLASGYINNWDLVDVSAPTIGRALVDAPGSTKLLRGLAKSTNLWERRASVILTFAHLREGLLTDCVRQAEMLVDDKHDLIQKAVGWTMREVGKRNGVLLVQFLERHAATMPRTALRYAIEKLPESKRRYWLNLKSQAN